MTMDKQSTSERRYEITTCRMAVVSCETVETSDIESVQVDEFDMAIVPCLGLFGIRHSNGRWEDRRREWRGIGPVGLAIIRAVQLNAGEFLTPPDLAEITGFFSLRGNEVLATSIYRLRRALDSKPEHFVETRRAGGYAIRWPPSRSWIWIDRIHSIAVKG